MEEPQSPAMLPFRTPPSIVPQPDGSGSGAAGHAPSVRESPPQKPFLLGQPLDSNSAIENKASHPPAAFDLIGHNLPHIPLLAAQEGGTSTALVNRGQVTMHPFLQDQAPAEVPPTPRLSTMPLFSPPQSPRSSATLMLNDLDLVCAETLTSLAGTVQNSVDCQPITPPPSESRCKQPRLGHDELDRQGACALPSQRDVTEDHLRNSFHELIQRYKKLQQEYKILEDRCNIAQDANERQQTLDNLHGYLTQTTVQLNLSIHSGDLTNAQNLAYILLGAVAAIGDDKDRATLAIQKLRGLVPGWFGGDEQMQISSVGQVDNLSNQDNKERHVSSNSIVQHNKSSFEDRFSKEYNDWVEGGRKEAQDNETSASGESSPVQADNESHACNNISACDKARQLMEENGLLKAELTKTHREASQLNKDKSSMSTRINQLAAERSNLKALNQKAVTEIERLKKSNEHLVAETNNLEAENVAQGERSRKTAEAEKKVFERRLEGCLAKREELRQYSSKLQIRIEELEAAAVQDRDLHLCQGASHQNQIEQLESEIGRLEQQYSEDHAAWMRDHEALRASVATARQERHNAEDLHVAERKMLQERLEQLEAELATERSRFDAAHDEWENQRSSMDGDLRWHATLLAASRHEVEAEKEKLKREQHESRAFKHNSTLIHERDAKYRAVLEAQNMILKAHREDLGQNTNGLFELVRLLESLNPLLSRIIAGAHPENQNFGTPQGFTIANQQFYDQVFEPAYALEPVNSDETIPQQTDSRDPAIDFVTNASEAGDVQGVFGRPDLHFSNFETRPSISNPHQHQLQEDCGTDGVNEGWAATPIWCDETLQCQALDPMSSKLELLHFEADIGTVDAGRDPSEGPVLDNGDGQTRKSSTPRTVTQFGESSQGMSYFDNVTTLIENSEGWLGVPEMSMHCLDLHIICSGEHQQEFCSRAQRSRFKACPGSYRSLVRQEERHQICRSFSAPPNISLFAGPNDDVSELVAHSNNTDVNGSAATHHAPKCSDASSGAEAASMDATNFPRHPS